MARICLIALLVSPLGFSQTVVPIDEETREFISDVNYHLFLDNKEIFMWKCDNDRATEIFSTAYDSIAFKKLGYEDKGFAKDKLPAVKTIFLTPKTFPLDEVTLLRRSPTDTLLGEKGKLYRKRSRPLLDHLTYALRIANPYAKPVKVLSFRFSVENVKYKTAYKLCFYRMPNERFPMFYFDFFGRAFETDVLYLDSDDKGEIVIDLSDFQFELPDEGVLASIELVGYADTSGNPVVPDLKDRTKVAFQYSKKTDYFARTSDYHSKKESNDLININARINYDFALMNFGKPDKSDLLAPAYFLEVKRD